MPSVKSEGTSPPGLNVYSLSILRTMTGNQALLFVGTSFDAQLLLFCPVWLDVPGWNRHGGDA